MIVTLDTDFLRIHSAGRAHPGIAFYPAGGRSVGDVIRGVRLIWELLEPADMANQIEYL